jgi:hypothetical protein
MFVYGHVHKGKKFTESHKNNISKSLTGKKLSKAHKEKLSVAAKKRMTDPREREKAALGRKGKKITEEHKEAIRQANSGKHVSKETRQKLSKQKQGERNPMYGKTGSNHHWFGQNHKPETIEKMSGENNHCWIDGSHMIYKYKQHSKKHKERILKRDNYQCQNLYHNEYLRDGKTPNKTKLCIHHIDGNGLNYSDINKITLCHSCNIREFKKREEWRHMFEWIAMMNEVKN